MPDTSPPRAPHTDTTTDPLVTMPIDARDVALECAFGARRVSASLNRRGGGLRALAVDGVDLVETYPAGGDVPACAGAVLFPWANRVRDGRWSQRGVEYQLPVNEPALGNAAHGLVRDVVFTVAERTQAEATLTTEVMPQPGYPFALGLALTYRLTVNGIDVRHRIGNRCGWPAPVCVGAHPYPRIGAVPTDDLTLTVRAGTYFPVDERLLPIGERDVTGTVLDLRDGRRIGGLSINTCFGGIEATGGRHRHRIEAEDGRSVEVWTDVDFGYVQVYRCAEFPRVDRVGGTTFGGALAIEPMTAPPDALNSGVGVRWLDPGEEWTASWGITATL